ncbi:MAG: hypothetical protein FJ379_12305 [Verrucomicrobia bacterium]|nr:hypothetical protein [Verrucomicrobiota bacterium]
MAFTSSAEAPPSRARWSASPSGLGCPPQLPRPPGRPPGPPCPPPRPPPKPPRPRIMPRRTSLILLMRPSMTPHSASSLMLSCSR